MTAMNPASMLRKSTDMAMNVTTSHSTLATALRRVTAMSPAVTATSPPIQKSRSFMRRHRRPRRADTETRPYARVRGPSSRSLRQVQPLGGGLVHEALVLLHRVLDAAVAAELLAQLVEPLLAEDHRLARLAADLVLL